MLASLIADTCVVGVAVHGSASRGVGSGADACRRKALYR